MEQKCDSWLAENITNNFTNYEECDIPDQAALNILSVLSSGLHL
jgi:hypothetical protein